ncbi:unnamed protein product [Discula destructiva]
MDFRKWKRQNSVHSLHALAVDESSSSSPGGSSPTSSIHESRNSSILSSMRRSLSRASISQRKKPTSTYSSHPATPGTPGQKRVLHKRAGSSSSFDNFNVGRRLSATSERHKRQSRALSLTMSSSRLPMTGIDFRKAIDWKTQRVEAHCALETDPQVLRGKPSYLVVTPDYIVKMRSRTEALATFPQIGSVNSRDEAASSLLPPPEPLLVIPIHMVVSVFMAESSRPSFGIEIWWRSPTCRAAYCSTQAYFVMPEDRAEMMRTVGAQVKAKSNEFPEASLVPLEVEARIMDIFAREEPEFKTCKPEIFPVVRRTSVREDVLSKDKTRKSHDGASWYLALGRNSCYLAEVAPGLPVDVKYQSFGLLTLDSFRANWTFHEERFVLSFREPFMTTVTLELASRYYRQIVITFMKADRFLKPCWPTCLQTLEIFRVAGLTDPQFLIAGDNYGGLKRTLDAFLTAYHCSPVEWEINWRTAYAPEFRLLPPRVGGTYSNLQLLAVMRSLRYNGYFNSISFADVDLSGLWEKLDTSGRATVPYMNRSCLALSEVELGHVKYGSLLHKEIHAMAFCSETIRQIDFTHCFTERNVRRNMLSSQDGPGFLFPILNLLELGLTKCNRLLLSGNYLRSADIDNLVEALITQQVEIQALDISNCGLSDLALRDIFEVLFHQSHSIQALNMSDNRGRVHVSLIANLCQSILDLRKLNVAGVIMGDIPGPIFSFETLSRFDYLEELDLSHYKVNDATLNALEKFLHQKPSSLGQSKADTRRDSQASSPPVPTFRKLALNNCGINGREAARLLRSMANHSSAHLHLNGNPLEDGIDDLCRAITHTPGPTGLHMDMAEFRLESNFVALMKALTANTNITFLSMVGTAPTPSVDGPCGTEVCHALEAFFQGNKSVRYLDLSGYSGKLDEAQLAPGFARSLRGLAGNTTLTHLRIRNQNLHDDVGTLGTVIRQNKTLRMIDCQENNWNLTSIQFLVKSLRLNRSIVQFPFPHPEYERVLCRVVADTRRSGHASGSGSNSKAAVAAYQDQESILRTALLRQVHELTETVTRNRELAEEDGLVAGFAVDFEESTDTGGERGWPSLQMKVPSTNNSSSGSGSGIINKGQQSRQRSKTPPRLEHDSSPVSPKRLLDFDLDADLMVTPVVELPMVDMTRKIHELEVSSKFVRLDVTSDTIASENPYHISRDAPLLETPEAEAGGCSPTTTDVEMPVTPSTPRTGRSSGAEFESGFSSEDGQSWASSFDMGPYFAGSGSRDFGSGRFRLEAHQEE